MEDAELRQKLEELDKKISGIYISAEKTRKYFLTVLIITLVTLILPLFGLFYAIPTFISSYGNIGNLEGL